MNTSLSRLALVLAVAAVWLASGCSSPPTRFYVLAPMPLEKAVGVGQDVAVGVGPVDLPEYLDRPQIVTRTGENELSLADFDHWAEPLEDNAVQVMAENLAVLLPSRRISVYPWKRSTPLNYQVAVKITRFDQTTGGEAVLNTRWRILSGDGQQELFSRESRYAERPAGHSHAATVAAMNRALARFSRDVAGAIAEQLGGNPQSP